MGHAGRPKREMWDAAAVVGEVHDGHTFTIPFVDKGAYTPNAYWIKGYQVIADGLTVGPKYTPDIAEHDGWIRVTATFDQHDMPEEVWESRPDQNGSIKVFLEIPPDTIDWVVLNAGLPARSKK